MLEEELRLEKEVWLPTAQQASGLADKVENRVI